MSEGTCHKLCDFEVSGRHSPNCTPPASDRDLGCFWHGIEPCDGAYRVCGECGHCWMTQEDLMADVIKMAQECGLESWPVGPEYVFHCPLCAHDF